VTMMEAQKKSYSERKIEQWSGKDPLDDEPSAAYKKTAIQVGCLVMLFVLAIIFIS
jgi:hypothetical protein